MRTTVLSGGIFFVIGIVELCEFKKHIKFEYKIIKINNLRMDIVDVLMKSMVLPFFISHNKTYLQKKKNCTF